MRGRTAQDPAGGDLILLAACLAVALLGYVIPRHWATGLVSAIRGSALRPVVALQTRATEDRTSRFRLDGIQRERDSLALMVQASTGLRQENQALRGLLALGAVTVNPFVNAPVLHRPVPTDSRTLLLGRGARDGVQEYSPVLTADGLLGFVWNVGAASSTALTWEHPEFRASAVTADGEVLGILVPAPPGMLELRGVAFRDTLAMGTVVETAGLGGVYPQGIPVGRVVGRGTDPLGYEQIYEVAPFANPGNAANVIILSRPDSALISPIVPPTADSIL